MVTWGSRQLGDMLRLAIGVVGMILLNQLAAIYFFRVDLTDEGRYTMKGPTRELLRNLEDDVYVEVFLEGDLNAPFRRLHKAVRETLEEFRVYSRNKVHYTFTDPSTAAGGKARQEFMASLAAKGIQPMNIIDNRDGHRTETLVFPGALISFGSQEKGIMLLKDHLAQRSEDVLNQSIEGLEFSFAGALDQLTNLNRKKIAFLTGHGELDSLRTASITASLQDSYDVFKVDLTTRPSLKGYDVLIMAKPTRMVSEPDKYKLDQYLIHGGKILLLLDELEVNMDSVSSPHYFASQYDQSLGDQLFHYGVRINQDIVQDLVSLHYPVVTGTLNGKAQVTPIQWPLFPMVNHYADHRITRNLDATALKIASSIDTVRAMGIRKTPLFFTSDYSRLTRSPVQVNVNDLRKEIKPDNFKAGPLALAYLLEGRFTSLYKNRFLPEGTDASAFLADGVDSKLIVVSDGDLASNEINARTGQPQPLGFDAFSGYTFANRELILNMVAYLADDSGLIIARNKVVKVRPLDKAKIGRERFQWQALNLALPIVLVILAGVAKSWWRRRKYGSFEIPASER